MNLKEACKKLNNNFFFYINQKTDALLCSNWMLNIEDYSKCIVDHYQLADLLEGTDRVYMQVSHADDFAIYEVLTDDTLKHAIMKDHKSFSFSPVTLVGEFIVMIDKFDDVHFPDKLDLTVGEA